MAIGEGEGDENASLRHSVQAQDLWSAIGEIADESPAPRRPEPPLEACGETASLRQSVQAQGMWSALRQPPCRNPFAASSWEPARTHHTSSAHPPSQATSSDPGRHARAATASGPEEPGSPWMGRSPRYVCTQSFHEPRRDSHRHVVSRSPPCVLLESTGTQSTASTPDRRATGASPEDPTVPPNAGTAPCLTQVLQNMENCLEPLRRGDTRDSWDVNAFMSSVEQLSGHLEHRKARLESRKQQSAQLYQDILQRHERRVGESTEGVVRDIMARSQAAWEPEVNSPDEIRESHAGEVDGEPSSRRPQASTELDGSSGAVLDAVMHRTSTAGVVQDILARTHAEPGSPRDNGTHPRAAADSERGAGVRSTSPSRAHSEITRAQELRLLAEQYREALEQSVRSGDQEPLRSELSPRSRDDRIDAMYSDWTDSDAEGSDLSSEDGRPPAPEGGAAPSRRSRRPVHPAARARTQARPRERHLNDAYWRTAADHQLAQFFRPQPEERRPGSGQEAASRRPALPLADAVLWQDTEQQRDPPPRGEGSQNREWQQTMQQRRQRRQRARREQFVRRLEEPRTIVPEVALGELRRRIRRQVTGTDQTPSVNVGPAGPGDSVAEGGIEGDLQVRATRLGTPHVPREPEITYPVGTRLAWSPLEGVFQDRRVVERAVAEDLEVRARALWPRGESFERPRPAPRREAAEPSGPEGPGVPSPRAVRPDRSVSPEASSTATRLQVEAQGLRAPHGAEPATGQPARGRGRALSPEQRDALLRVQEVLSRSTLDPQRTAPVLEVLATALAVPARPTVAAESSVPVAAARSLRAQAASAESSAAAAAGGTRSSQETPSGSYRGVDRAPRPEGRAPTEEMASLTGALSVRAQRHAPSVRSAASSRPATGPPSRDRVAGASVAQAEAAADREEETPAVEPPPRYPDPGTPPGEPRYAPSPSDSALWLQIRRRFQEQLQSMRISAENAFLTEADLAPRDGAPLNTLLSREPSAPSPRTWLGPSSLSTSTALLSEEHAAPYSTNGSDEPLFSARARIERANAVVEQHPIRGTPDPVEVGFERFLSTSASRQSTSVGSGAATAPLAAHGRVRDVGRSVGSGPRTADALAAMTSSRSARTVGMGPRHSVATHPAPSAASSAENYNANHTHLFRPLEIEASSSSRTPGRGGGSTTRGAQVGYGRAVVPRSSSSESLQVPEDEDEDPPAEGSNESGLRRVLSREDRTRNLATRPLHFQPGLATLGRREPRDMLSLLSRRNLLAPPPEGHPEHEQEHFSFLPLSRRLFHMRKLLETLASQTHLHQGRADECSICLDPLHQTRVSKLGCEHVFHAECIHKWIVSCNSQHEHEARETRCPLCKQLIKARGQ